MCVCTLTTCIATCWASIVYRPWLNSVHQLVRKVYCSYYLKIPLQKAHTNTHTPKYSWQGLGLSVGRHPLKEVTLVLGDVMRSSLVCTTRFGGTCHFHLRGIKESVRRKRQVEPTRRHISPYSAVTDTGTNRCLVHSNRQLLSDHEILIWLRLLKSCVKKSKKQPSLGRKNLGIKF